MIERNWLTSQELAAKYGFEVTYGNASRTAKRIVKDYGLPYYLDGRKWRSYEVAASFGIREES